MFPAALIAAISKKVGDPLAFYSVAATVLPVFFIALAYQASILERSPFDAEPPSDDSNRKLLQRVVDSTGKALAYWVLLTNLVGELFALWVLASQVPNAHYKAFIGLVLYANGLTMLLQRTILALESGTGHHGDNEERSRVLIRRRESLIFVFILLLLVGILIYASAVVHL
jgi:hypothetical protein